MFGFLKKKTEIERDIEQRGIHAAARDAAAAVSRHIPDRDVAFRVIIEELDGARQGNEASREYARQSGIPEVEYLGALNNDDREVYGPQEVILAISLQSSKDMEAVSKFRCAIGDMLMRQFKLGRYLAS